MRKIMTGILIGAVIAAGICWGQTEQSPQEFKNPAGVKKENVVKGLRKLKETAKAEQDYLKIISQNREDVKIIAYGDYDSLPLLVKEIKQKTNPTAYRIALMQMLYMRKDNRAVETLWEALNEPDKDIRMHSIVLLGLLKDKRSTQRIIEFIDDPDKRIRDHAVKALGNLQDEKGIEVLINQFSREKEFIVRCHILESIGNICKEKRNQQGVDLLIRALEDNDESVRSNAANALGAIREKSAVPYLVRKLKEEKGSVSKSNAVYALGSIGDISALRPLVDALEDPTVGDEAAVSLGLLKRKEAIEPLEKYFEKSRSEVAEKVIENLKAIKQ